MRKSKVIFPNLFLIIILILSACSTDNTVNTDSSSSTDNNTNDQEVYVFKSSTHAPQQIAFAQGFDAYLDKVEELSDGRIEFERYYSESLVSSADQLDALSTGIADIALILPFLTPGKTPLSTIGTLPALWENQWPATMAYAELFDQVPELNAEFEDINVKAVGHWALSPYYIVSKNKIENFADIQGEKFVAQGAQALIAEALGGVPVGVSYPETFEAIERDVAGGAFYGLSASAGYGIHEAVNYVWKLPVGSPAGIFGMNLPKFNELPEDLQDVFKEAAIQNAVDFHNIYQVDGDEGALNLFEEAGVEIIEPTTKQLTEVQEISRNTVWNKWIEDNESAGSSEELVDTFIEILEKYEKEFEENGLPQ